MEVLLRRLVDCHHCHTSSLNLREVLAEDGEVCITADVPGEEFDDCAGMNASISQSGAFNERSYVGVRWWMESFGPAKITWKRTNTYRGLSFVYPRTRAMSLRFISARNSSAELLTSTQSWNEVSKGCPSKHQLADAAGPSILAHHTANDRGEIGLADGTVGLG